MALGIQYSYRKKTLRDNTFKILIVITQDGENPDFTFCAAIFFHRPILLYFQKKVSIIFKSN